MSIVSEFKEFISKGNVLDLAVAVVVDVSGEHVRLLP